MTGRAGLLSFWKRVSLLEKAIPPGPVDQGGEINRDITEQLRSSSVPDDNFDDWVHIITLGSNDPDDDTAIVDDEYEDAMLKHGRYFCDDDVQRSLQEFHDALHALWPVGCKSRHTSMLRLATCRQHGELPEGHAGIEFDTLSSEHDQYWARITFVLHSRAKRSSPRVKFDEPVGENNKPPDEPNESPHNSKRALDETGGSPDEMKHFLKETLPAPPTLCSIIEHSANNRLHTRVDLKSLASKPGRGKGIRSRKPMVALNDLLTPSKVACSGGQIARAVTSPTPRQKAELAVVLACSLLQLCKGAWGANAGHEGAWLHRDWTKHGICFLLNEKEPDISRPYLPIIFDKPAEGSVYDYDASSVVAFAITLVQFQESEVVEELDSIRKGQLEDGGRTPNFDYCAVLELLERKTFKQHVDDQYQKAIRACFKLFADGFDQEESVIQRRFFTMVVAPLVEYYQQIEQSTTTGGPPRTLSSERQRDKKQERQLSADVDEVSQIDSQAIEDPVGGSRGAAKKLSKMECCSAPLLAQTTYAHYGPGDIFIGDTMNKSTGSGTHCPGATFLGPTQFG